MDNRWKVLMVLLACGCLVIGCDKNLVIGGDKDGPDTKTPKKIPEVKKSATPKPAMPKSKPAMPKLKPATPKPEPATPKTPGPKDVALAILQAMREGDGEAVAAHTDCSDEDKAFIKKSFPIMSKVVAFSLAGRKAYGKEAWAAAAKKVDMAHFAEPPKELDPAAEKTLKCKVEGDKATCTMDGIKKPLELVRKGGVWLALPDDMPPNEQRAEMLVAMSAMAKAAEAAMGKIGKEGVTAEKVFEVFDKALKETPKEP